VRVALGWAEGWAAYQCRTPNKCSRTIATIGTPSNQSRISRPIVSSLSAGQCIGSMAPTVCPSLRRRVRH
jgi:hypothetical protein